MEYFIWAACLAGVLFLEVWQKMSGVTLGWGINTMICLAMAGIAQGLTMLCHKHKAKKAGKFSQKEKVHRTESNRNTTFKEDRINREETTNEIFYMDADGNPTDKEHAVRCHIHVYDRDGKLVQTVYGICGQGNECLSREAQQETPPAPIEQIMNNIRDSLTGESQQDRAYLVSQIDRYTDHPQSHEIIRRIALLIYDNLSDREKAEYAQAMEEDDRKNIEMS